MYLVKEQIVNDVCILPEGQTIVEVVDPYMYGILTDAPSPLPEDDKTDVAAASRPFPLISYKIPPESDVAV